MLVKSAKKTMKQHNKLTVFETYCCYILIIVPFDTAKQLGKGMRIMEVTLIAKSPHQVSILFVQRGQRVFLNDLPQFRQVLQLGFIVPFQLNSYNKGYTNY